METQTKPTKVSADQVTADTATQNLVTLDYDESRESVLTSCYSNGTYISVNTSDDELYQIAEQWVTEEEELTGYKFDFSGVFDGLRDYIADRLEWLNRNPEEYPSTLL